MTIITAHGYDFAIDRSGWGSHEADAETAEDRLKMDLRAMDPRAVAELHAALTADPGHPAATELADKAASAVTRDWTNTGSPNSAPGLTLTAS